MGNTNTIIIMQGGPTTGKTTIGKRLAASLKLPYFSKDGVKEPLFDHIGCPTEWETDHPLSGRKMDDAAIAILFYLMETQLQAGFDCVIDSTFVAHHVPALLELKSRYPFTPIQILCRADAAELTRRHRRRAEGGERHPGHLDQRISDAFDAVKMERRYRPLEIGGHVLDADTTDFKEDDFRKLLKSIESLER